VQNEAIPTVTPEGQTEKGKALTPRVKAANGPAKWAKRSQESIWESGGEAGDGAGKRVVECEMCTENDKEGRGWESGSKGCRGAEHGQTCIKDRTDAVALRAALESAVRLGRCHEVNRQAEMANPAKCRDSLQVTRRGVYACPGLEAFTNCLTRSSLL
jgi:hypothetical protein